MDEACGGWAREFLSRLAEYRCMCPTRAPAPTRQAQGRKWAVTWGCWPYKQVLESAWALCLHHRPCLGDRIRRPGHDKVVSREGTARPILTPVPVTPAVGKPLLLSSWASIRECSKEGSHLTQHPWSHKQLWGQPEAQGAQSACLAPPESTQGPEAHTPLLEPSIYISADSVLSDPIHGVGPQALKHQHNQSDCLTRHSCLWGFKSASMDSIQPASHITHCVMQSKSHAISEL